VAISVPPKSSDRFCHSPKDQEKSDERPKSPEVQKSKFDDQKANYLYFPTKLRAPGPKTSIAEMCKNRNLPTKNKAIHVPPPRPSPKSQALHFRNVQKSKFDDEKQSSPNSLTKPKTPSLKSSTSEKCKNRNLMTKKQTA
jgi:hypothetical protein